MRFLTLDEYDGVLQEALCQHGLSIDDARRLIAGRWPMFASALVSEAFGRGLVVTQEAVADYTRGVLAEIDPGADDDPLELLVGPATGEAFMAWAVDNQRAQPTAVGRRLADDQHGVLPAILQGSKSGEN